MTVGFPLVSVAVNSAVEDTVVGVVRNITNAPIIAAKNNNRNQFSLSARFNFCGIAGLFSIKGSHSKNRDEHKVRPCVTFK